MPCRLHNPLALTWNICRNVRETESASSPSGSISNSPSDSNTSPSANTPLSSVSPSLRPTVFRPVLLLTKSPERPTQYQSKRYLAERLEHQAARRCRYCCSNRRISRPARSNDVTGNFLFHAVNSFWYEGVVVGVPLKFGSFRVAVKCQGDGPPTLS
jgi:hypothetical protein